MASHHEEAALPNARYAATIFGASIHGNTFAQLAARPDNQLRGAAAVMHRLRRRPKRSKGLDNGAFADSRDSGDVNVGDEAHTIAELHIGPDCAVGTDLDIVADARPGGHARGWIDRHLILG
jgi:hypothetical protein